MEYLRLENISKSYGDKVLFTNLNFILNEGDRIGLIAKNGHGKSTLLRIIAGEEPSDGAEARVFLNKSVSMCYLEQDPEMEQGLTVLDSLFSVDSAAVRAIKMYEHALLSQDDLAIEKAIVQMEDAKAWDIESKMKEVLFKLNLKDMNQKVSLLSGGQKKRLSLAKMVLTEPELILLDEPTNHLDIDMVEWLENYLMTTSVTLLMVTHDRYFMENICETIIELDNGTLYKYDGNYSTYLEKKALRQENDRVVLDKTKKLFLKELEWVRRQPKARTTKAKSRIHQYDKIKDKISSISYDEVFKIEIETDRLGKKIVEFADASKRFDEIVILTDFWYKFKPGEKVGICGPNGSGKTTLVNLITGEVPLDSGKRTIGDTVKFGYYRQDGLSFQEDQRIIDVIREVGEYIPLKKGLKLSAEKLLENFMFDRLQQTVKVSQLSGGERKRLHLLKVLMSNPNFLILDEPTNDLDVLTLNVLEEYLSKFPGCVLIVTHDRYFMDKLVDHLFILSGDGGVTDFNGTYTAWRNLPKEYTETKKITQKSIKDEEAVSNLPIKRKLSYLEKKEMTELESRMAKLDQRKKEITLIFSTDDHMQGSDVEALSVELGRIKDDLDTCEMRWLELADLEEN